MKLAVFSTLFAGAAALAAKKGVSKPVGFEAALGAQEPLGLYDPLGLLDNADEARFDRLRYVELKHGRISMLAVLGHIVTSSGTRLPGDIDFSGTSKFM